MDQIKLLRQTNQRFHQSQNYEFQEVVINAIRKKNEQVESLEPWLEESDKNPFISFKSERIKKAQSPKLKKQGSLSIINNWKTPYKTIIQRQSKVLPVMDVGELNKIKKNNYPGKAKNKLDVNSPVKLNRKSSGASETTLPTVTRQLSIERKIFLMKHIGTQQNYDSPQKSHRIRNIISESRS